MVGMFSFICHLIFIWNFVKCRGDNFDRDLDDIMVMEAIWLSIQVIQVTSYS